MIFMSIYFQLNWSILFNFSGILCLLYFILLQSEAIVVISFYDLCSLQYCMCKFKVEKAIKMSSQPLIF